MYLDWQSRPEDYYAIDIETDSLAATVIWVMCWQNIKNPKEKGRCVGHDQVKEFFKATRGSIYVAHNGVKFDIAVVNRLLGVGVKLSRVIDTFFLSTLYSPSLTGGHSLKAWGERLGCPKTDYSDWAKYTEEMALYCEKDVEILTKLFRRLSIVMARIGFSEKSCYIQHYFTAILEKQRKNGFYFDGPRAIVFLQQLRGLENEYGTKIRDVFPARRHLVRHTGRFTKAGQPTAIYVRDSGRYEIQDDEAEYRAYAHTNFNIGSPDQRAERLFELGWRNSPDEVTKTGKPKPFEKGEMVASLEEFLEGHDVPEVKLIATWMAVNGRGNMVNNWLDNWDENTSCIHGNLFVADTLRLRHQSPNTANVPAVRKSKEKETLLGAAGFWTYEARDLWTARPGRTLVGTDAAGLELRMLAHYLNRPEFTDQVVNGDPHQYNAELVGIPKRTAKTLLYAIQYGAQDKKTASIIRGTLAEGKQIRTDFLERLGLKEIMNECIHEQRSGRIWLLDGSGIICPSPHSALNYKLQGGGARVMAQATIFLDSSIRSAGLDSLKVGDIHDEWQFDVAPSDAREHARLSVQAIRDAGEEFNLNLPLDGAAKNGGTWAETH